VPEAIQDDQTKRSWDINDDGSGKVNLFFDGQYIGSTNPLPINDIKYNTNDIEEASSTITYIGAEDKDGNWYIKKIDTTTGCVFSHATVKNNSGYTTYDTAWTARAGLTYQNYGDAF